MNPKYKKEYKGYKNQKACETVASGLERFKKRIIFYRNLRKKVVRRLMTP